MGYTLNFSAVWRNFDFLWSGLALSLGLAIISIVIGAVIGLVVAFALLSKQRFVAIPARCYVTLIRNLPILVLVLFAYFALPQMGFRLDKVKSFILVLSSIRAPIWRKYFAPGCCPFRRA